FLRLDNPSRELLNKILARKAAVAGPGATAKTPMALGGSGAHRVGTNGTAQPKVDTTVDLASEFGVDEARLRRAVDRNWLGAGKAAGEVDELEKLLKPEPVEPVS